MSHDASTQPINADSESRQPSLAADVSFTALGKQDADRTRPSTRRSDSTRNEKERWSARRERLKDRFLTPPRSLSSRKSEDTQRDSDGGSTAQRQSSLVSPSRAPSGKAAGKQQMGGPSSISSDKARSTSSQASSFNHTDSPAGLSLQGRGQRMSKSPSMDPAQLVQLALNLSESRRRHASNPSSSIAASLNNRARVSLDSPASSGVLDAMYSSPASSTRDRPFSIDEPTLATGDGQLHFSPATLARAEKARRYFELADKHRRLLLQLPPVQVAQRRPRAFSKSGSVPIQNGQAGLSGRQYNPLQALRNRRLRQQSDMPMISADAFADLDNVERWLSQIETAAKSGDRANGIVLPVYTPIEAHTGNGPAIGHRRNGTADTVITKPEHQWSITPAELLADTYWTEQGQNLTTVDSVVTRNRGRSSTLNSISRPPTLPEIDTTPEKIRHNHLHLLPLNAANRLRQHKFTRRARSDSGSSASSTEGRRRVGTDLNIGPLQRHMDEMIRRDAGEEYTPVTQQSPDHWDTVRHRHKSIDRPHKRLPQHTVQHNGHILSPLTETIGQSDSARVLSSPDSSYPASPVIDRPALFTSDITSPKEPIRELNSPRSKLSLRDGNGTNLSYIDEADLEPVVPETVDPTRLSVDDARPTTFRRHKTTDSISNSLRGFVQSRSKTDGPDREPSSAVGRLLRGGRDMVRNESMKFGNRIRGRDRRGEASDVSAANTDVSDIEDGDERQVITSAEQSDVSPRASFEKPRARARYHVPHLPSFRSPRNPDMPTDDHISRQQADMRRRNRSPRFDRLGPPRISLPDDSRDEGFPSITTDKSSGLDDRRQSYGFLNPALRHRARSHSKTRSFLNRTRSNQQPAGNVLSPVSTQSSGHARQWSISDQRPPGIFSAKEHGVRARDVARVRTLLLASGIKAREISRRLSVQSTEQPSFLLEAARLSDVNQAALEKRPQQEETVYAVEMLSGYIDSMLAKLSKDIESFQTRDLQGLITRQDKLRVRVSDELTELVHSASDQADGFNIELSTQATLRTKQIDDAINSVVRLRRRQFRLLRLAAFKMLELVTLSLLWTVWFIVVCVKTVQRIVLNFFRLLRWLLIF